MVFVPYSTDAPLYHWPFTTCATVAINVFAFCYTATFMHEHPAALDPYILQYGDGYHPTQWITSSFLHADLLHLLGNMVFLLVYGTIVEGKIGWWKMVLLILGIGIAQNFIEQTIALGTTDVSGSLGASSIIYGLMTICLIWAPMNNVSCVFIFFYRLFHVEIPVLYLVGAYLLLQSSGFVFSDFAWSSQFLHLLGAVVGGAVGLIMFKRGMVDCEGWDVFSVLHGKEGGPLEEHGKRREANEEKESQRQQVEEQLSRRELALQEFRELLAQGQPKSALQIHQQMLADSIVWKIPEPYLLQLINAFQSQQLWSESIPVMVEYLKKFTANADSVRIKLAQVLLLKGKRPAQALLVLEKLNPALLDPALAAQVQQLKKKASQVNNPYEVADQDW